MPPLLNHKPTSEIKGSVAVTLQSSYLGCFAHAGFINALLDSGVRPTKISGSSSGAIIAAAYASGLEGDPLKDFILDSKFLRSFFEWRALLRSTTVFAFCRGQGIIRGHRAVKHLSQAIPVQHIENTPNAELSIGVTNFTRKKRQLITCGEIAPFIVASCAVPPVICAQEIDGELYLDGGFTDESPFEQWIDDSEIKTIIIHQVKSDNTNEKPATKQSNFIYCWSAMHSAAADELLKARIAKAEAFGKRVIIYETITPKSKLIASPKQAAANYQTAYDTFNKAPSQL